MQVLIMESINWVVHKIVHSCPESPKGDVTYLLNGYTTLFSIRFDQSFFSSNIYMGEKN